MHIPLLSSISGIFPLLKSILLGIFSIIGVVFTSLSPRLLLSNFYSVT